MQSLIIKHNNNLVTALQTIADIASTDITSMQRLIRTHKIELEIFGTLDFDNIKTTGRPKKLYYLNEQQSYLFITFLKNTKVVKDFKIALIREFFEMRESLNKNTQQIQPQPTHHQIIGYKSQLSQRNKKIEFLEGQVTTLQKMSENLLK